MLLCIQGTCRYQRNLWQETQSMWIFGWICLLSWQLKCHMMLPLTKRGGGGVRSSWRPDVTTPGLSYGWKLGKRYRYPVSAVVKLDAQDRIVWQKVCPYNRGTKFDFKKVTTWLYVPSLSSDLFWVNFLS